MSENWKIQVSPKLTDGTLINLRAQDGPEAVQILDWVIANTDKIGEAVRSLNAVSTFTQAFPGAQVTVEQPPAQQAPPQQGGWNAPAQTPPPQWAQGNPQEIQQHQQAHPHQYQQQAPPPQQYDEGLIPQQHCSHGPMQLRRAKPNSGKNWVAYMCPTKQGTPGQCSPVDAKTGKSWNS